MIHSRRAAKKPVPGTPMSRRSATAETDAQNVIRRKRLPRLHVNYQFRAADARGQVLETVREGCGCRREAIERFRCPNAALHQAGAGRSRLGIEEIVHDAALQRHRVRLAGDDDVEAARAHVVALIARDANHRVGAGREEAAARRIARNDRSGVAVVLRAHPEENIRAARSTAEENSRRALQNWCDVIAHGNHHSACRSQAARISGDDGNGMLTNAQRRSWRRVLRDADAGRAGATIRHRYGNLRQYRAARNWMGNESNIRGTLNHGRRVALNDGDCERAVGAMSGRVAGVAVYQGIAERK